MPNYDSIEYFTTNLSAADGDHIWAIPGFPGVTVERKIFHGGPSDGVELFVLSNDSLSVYVMPTRGMGIWKVQVKQGAESVRVGWNSPVPFPVNPRNVPLDQPDGLGWLRGFNEFVARCGLESNGAPEFNANGTLRFGLHGRIQNTPAFCVRLEADAEKQEIRLTGRMFEGRLFFNTLELESTLTVPFYGASFRVDDTVRNQAARPAEIELLYHVNTGNPVADGGARMEIPFKRLIPRCPWAAQNLETVAELHAPVTGEPEMCYYYELAADSEGNTRTFLRNPAGNFGITLAFNQNEFPFFCQWKAQHAARDGYVTGMEPCINFPNSRAFEYAHGRVATLEPNTSRHFGITFRFSTTPAEVNAASAAVAELQASVASPVVESAPNPEWCE